MSEETLKLPERVGVDLAQEALSLAVSLGDDASLRIDADGVEQIDGPAVVALANIARVAAERGRPVKIMAPSDALIAGFTDLGLYGELMKMEFGK